MAKRQTSKKLTATPVARAVQAVETDTLPEDDDIRAALDAIAQISGTSGGADIECKVYQVDKAGRGAKGGLAFLFPLPIEELGSLETNLADSYPMGGTFRAIVRVNGQILRNVTVEIAPRPGYRAPPPSYLAPLQPVAAVAEPGRDPVIAQLIEMQRANDQRMTQLFEMVARGNQTQPPTLESQLAAFTQFQALIPKGTQENVMDTFQKGMTFAREIFEASGGGGGGGGATIMDLAMKALESPVIKDILAGAANGAATAAAAAPKSAPAIPDLSNAMPVAPAPSPAATPAIDPNNPAHQHIITTLIGQAEQKADPAIIAEQALQSLPAAIIDELELQADVVGYLVGLFPAIAAHRPWFESLVANMWEPELDGPALTLNDANARLPGSAGGPDA